MTALRRLAPATAALLVLLLCATLRAAAVQLPARLSVPAPFPAIVAQAPTLSTIAPGVQEGDYDVLTGDGPIVVHVVAIDMHRRALRVGTVLADGRLTSDGETVASMARRTGAVAGINGDYFDINSTNQPTNVLVRNGTLLRTPIARAAVAISRDGSVHVGPLTFTGTVQVGSRNTTLDGVNVLPPPDGGTALLTPEFGSVPPAANLTLIGLQLLDGSPPFARYRVTNVADNTTVQPAGYYLAIGMNAYGSAGVPNPGDVVVPSGDLAPVPLANIAAAVGGGPVILRSGVWYDDPNGPSGGEFMRRIPASGIAVAPDGTLFLIEVDGRQPLLSIGVTRPQFAALMRAFGASDGMSLDGGGSSTLVARDPGDAQATTQNVPSDGHDRPVADGIFVYDDDPVGAPSHIAIRPSSLHTLVGGALDTHVAVTDASGHPVAAPTPIRLRVEPADLGDIVDGAFVAKRAGSGRLVARSGAIVAEAPVTVTDRPARIDIVPDRANVNAGGTMQFVVRAYDADGFPLALPRSLAWTATSGRIDARGTYVAGSDDATVSVRLGSAVTRERVTVGQHERPISFGSKIAFSSAPRGGAGGVVAATPCRTCVQLSYDFTGDERAAYADLDVPLPDDALGIAFDVQGDGSGAVLRVAMRNAINERVLLTATTLDFTGWRHVVVAFPRGDRPADLAAIYVLNGLGSTKAQTAGTIALRDLSVVLPGTGTYRGERRTPITRP